MNINGVISTRLLLSALLALLLALPVISQAETYSYDKNDKIDGVLHECVQYLSCTGQWDAAGVRKDSIA